MQDEKPKITEAADRRKEAAVSVLKDRIAAHGYTFMLAADPDGKEPRFIHTVGAHLQGLPDVIVSGNIHPMLAQQLIAELYEHWGRDGKVSEGLIEDFARKDDDSGDWSVKVVKLNFTETVERYACMIADCFPDHHGEIYQLIWCDQFGKFPGDPLYSLQSTLAQTLFPRLQ